MVFGTAATLPPGSFTESANLTASTETFGDFEYKVLKDGTVEIHKYTGNASTLSIPSKIGGREVYIPLRLPQLHGAFATPCR